MEIHAHSHSSPVRGGAERKKWTHYLFEFLMLFLAVFCGFLAENIREHNIEHQRAKVLASSLYSDFRYESTEIKMILSLRKKQNDLLDTLLNEMEKPIPIQNDTLIFSIAGHILTKRNYLVPTIGTYEQVKQSGYLRYFKQDIAFNLVQYDRYQSLLAIKLDLENKFVFENIVPLTTKNLNQKYLKVADWYNLISFKEELMPKNHSFQNELYGQTRFLLERSRIYINSLKDLDSQSDICINLLKKEYFLK